MNFQNIFPLALGIVIFSFVITGILIVPFINLLYKFKLTRQKEGAKKGKVHLYDKLHDVKAGTPIGGGILVLLVVTVLFASIFPIASHMGVFIRSAYDLRWELIIIFFTFLSFGLLGLSDDLVKIFGKGKRKKRRMSFGLSSKLKFSFQWIFAFIIGYLIYSKLGVSFVHIPFLGLNPNLGVLYIPFAAFVVVAFSNAVNVTDGLDGLAMGLLMICLVAFGIIAAGNLDTPLFVFIALWIGSLIAFLYFNVWPARIFLGDAGALSFGAMLGVIGLLTGSIAALVVIGGMFVIELATSAIQIFGWKVLKRPIFPLAPIHHTFLAIGWEEPKIVMRAWLAGIMLAIFGLWLAAI